MENGGAHDEACCQGLARVNGREDSSVKKNRDEGSVHGSRVLSTVVGYGDEGDERLWFQPGIC